VLARAAQIQGVQAEELTALAQAQQQQVKTLVQSRGTIYDRAGEPIAVDQPSKTLVAYPHAIKSPVATAIFVAQQLEKKKKPRARLAEHLLETLKTPGAVQVVLGRQLPTEVVNRILASDLPGLDALDERRRRYPGAALASQLLGYTDIDGKGSAGLELMLDPYLAGRPGQEVVVRDSNGVPLHTASLREPEPGRGVHLTIDRAVQVAAQRVLDRTVRAWRARSATAVVMTPSTGEIFAMATAPSYDNNRVHDLPAGELFERDTNRAIEDQFEPGSTFKVVTMSAALSEGKVFPDMAFNDLPYELLVADRWIHDAESRGKVDLTASEILQHSSNVGTVTIAQLVGIDLMYKWIKRFRFGERALGFPAESPGVVPAPDQWSGSSIGNIPIGQGISVTAVQMASMYAAIANDGVMVDPHVVARVEGEDVPEPRRRRVLSRSVDAQLVDMLKGVVSDDGTGAAGRVPGYTVAGKTGTAEKPDGKGGYSDTDYVASFAGFLPADDPEIVIMVTVDTPRGNIYGGTVAAPAFAEIASFAVRALGIPPDRRRGG
jgi:cell division protein FtsI (penicillin-binding protein 3)